MANLTPIFKVSYSDATIGALSGNGLKLSIANITFTSNQTTAVVIIGATNVQYAIASPIGTGTDNSMQVTNTINESTGILGIAGGSLTLARTGTVAQDCLILLGSLS